MPTLSQTTVDFWENVYPDIPATMLTRQTRLREDLGMDSLRLVELVARVEEYHKIVLDEALLEPDMLQSIGDLEALVTRAGQELDVGESSDPGAD